MHSSVKSYVATGIGIASLVGAGRVIPPVLGILGLHVNGFFDWRVKPTYPASQVAHKLKELCAKEHHLTVEVRRQGKVLQVFFWRFGLLKSNEALLQPEAAKAIDDVFRAATRVALSSDAGIQFIQVKTVDVLTGGTLSLWSYVTDVRDLWYSRMPEEEYSNRLIFEIRLDGGYEMSQQIPPWDRPMTMREFLAKQVVQRARHQSAIGLEAHEDLSIPSTLVVVVDNWSDIVQQGAKEKAQVTDIVEKSAVAVVRGYQFKGFHRLVLQNERGVSVGSWKL